MQNHCWRNNFQNKNFNFLAKVVLDKIVLDYLLACARWFHYLVGCTETTLRACTSVHSQLKMHAEEIKAYQRVRASLLSTMWGGGVDFHRSFFTCAHPQVTGRCVHKLLGQAQVASAIIASRVSWSFSLGNYSFSTDSAILLRIEERFSKLSQTSVVGYHHHWKKPRAGANRCLCWQRHWVYTQVLYLHTHCQGDNGHHTLTKVVEGIQTKSRFHSQNIKLIEAKEGGSHI